LENALCGEKNAKENISEDKIYFWTVDAIPLTSAQNQTRKTEALVFFLSIPLLS